MEPSTVSEQHLEQLPEKTSEIDRPIAEPRTFGEDVVSRNRTSTRDRTLDPRIVEGSRQTAKPIHDSSEPVCLSLRRTRSIQRALDVLLTALALILFLPLFLIAAIAIKLDSPGPVFFFQERVGYRGAFFRLYKFRSMVPDAECRQAELWAENERDGPVFKIKNDPRVTRVGQYLRKYSIDELPQLLNVLKGDMSLVGPRPALPIEVEMYTPRQMERLNAVPGITGLWQISGRANLSFEESIDLDLHYIRTQSVRLYLRIILLTIPTVVLGDGAY